MNFGINMKNSTKEFNQIPTLIFCGGKGILLDEKQNHRINKGLIQVQGKPLFWWVMSHYALHGATDFILATGFQGEMFGAALEAVGATVDAAQSDCYVVNIAATTCSVRLVPTAQDATTGERLLACKPWLTRAERFALTYSDTLSDVDLSAEMRFHKSHKLVATLVAVQYPVRFRILGIRHGENIVRAFAPRPVIETASVNGGYYIFTSKVWDDAYGIIETVALENLPLERLAAVSQLAAFDHKGSWQNCDTERDLAAINKLALDINSHV
jgi:glucose-1-phosphate cytidylyltransferase